MKKNLSAALACLAAFSQAQLVGNATDLKNDIIACSNSNGATKLTKNEYWLRTTVQMVPSDIQPGKALRVIGHANGTTIYHGTKLESEELEGSPSSWTAFEQRIPSSLGGNFRVVDLSAVSHGGWVGAWNKKVKNPTETYDMHRGLEVTPTSYEQMPVFSIGGQKLRYAEANSAFGDNQFGWRHTNYNANPFSPTSFWVQGDQVLTDATGMRAIIFATQDYEPWNVAVDNINSVYTSLLYNTLTLKENPLLQGSIFYNSKNGNANLSQEQRVRLINVPEGLDEPGEYVIDLAAQKMYFVPIPGKPLDVAVGLPLRTTSSGVPTDKVWETPLQIGRRMNSSTDTTNVGFDGVIVEGITFDTAMASQLVLWNNSNVSIYGCTFRNMGRSGLRIYRNFNVTVTECEFKESDYALVQLYNSRGFFPDQRMNDDMRDATDHNFTIEASTFTHPGQLYPDGPAIFNHKSPQGLSGIDIWACSFWNTPGPAVSLDGVKNSVSESYFTNCVTEISDAGALYMGRSLIDTGTTFSQNWFKDIQPYDEGGWVSAINPLTNPFKKYDVNGVFLDDGQSGIVVDGNLFENVQTYVKVNGGRHNIVCHNVKKVGPSWVQCVPTDFKFYRIYTEKQKQHDANGVFANLVNDLKFGQTIVSNPSLTQDVYGETPWLTAFSGFLPFNPPWSSAGYDYVLNELDGVTTTHQLFGPGMGDWTYEDGVNRYLITRGNWTVCSGQPSQATVIGNIQR